MIKKLNQSDLFCNKYNKDFLKVNYAQYKSIFIDSFQNEYKFNCFINHDISICKNFIKIYFENYEFLILIGV